MKRTHLGLLAIGCLLCTLMVVPAFANSEDPFPLSRVSQRNLSANGPGSLVIESTDENTKLSFRRFPAMIPSHALQLIDSNGDAFFLNLRNKTLFVFDEDNELKLSKELEIGSSREKADWRLALSDNLLWIWSADEQQIIKLNKSSLEQVDVMEDITGATRHMQMAVGPKEDLYIWSAPYIWLIQDDWIARVDLRQFRVFSETVALTVSDKGEVFAVDPDTASLLIFDADLTERKIVPLAEFNGAGQVEIQVVDQRIYIYDREKGTLWVYFHPSRDEYLAHLAEVERMIRERRTAPVIRR